MRRPHGFMVCMLQGCCTVTNDNPDLFLTRFMYSHDCTLGVLHDHDNAFCVTLEDPWKENKVGISCIPDGVYDVVPHSGPMFKNVWRLLNVPGRSGILIHAGNSEADTMGCILVGTSFVPDKGKIAGSQLALGWLRDLLGTLFNNKFRLQVKSVRH